MPSETEGNNNGGRGVPVNPMVAAAGGAGLPVIGLAWFVLQASGGIEDKVDANQEAISETKYEIRALQTDVSGLRAAFDKATDDRFQFEEFERWTREYELLNPEAVMPDLRR